jgi:Exocyst complex component Sec3
MHLKAVSERAKGHTSISSSYCTALAQVIVTVMEQFKTEVVAGSDQGKVSKHDTHTQISKKIRDTQRKFQSALLNYIRLIEVLAALSPDMLPALRESYAEMVAEGILMKKRLKGYFQALPGKNVAYLNHAGKDLKDYTPGHFTEETVSAPDIRAAIGELFPVVAREAYFVSALFGSASREQDGREKKRNFENAKTAVDKASAHFQYYIKRSCGIVEVVPPGEPIPESDPLLCLVSTIYLHEAMDSYIDREKKGGDHSLSLAYVRSTIIDLRKKIDKQWSTWVDKQLDWIKSADGVPVTGKRAGILSSFARFPMFLDHVLLCCKEGRDESYEPDLAGIRVVNFYMQKMAAALLESLKECAARETTDQAYASNVMLMENTYFFNEAIKQRGKMLTAMFAKQMTRANAICKESTDSYLGWMIKREFAALHELFSRVSKIRKELGDHEVAANVPKSQFVRTLQKEASREVLKEKIATMYSRMEKHLCEEGGLLPVAWKALVKVMYEWFGRWEKLCTAIYRHKLDPGAKDIVRIAKAAGGEAKVKVTSQPGEFGFKSILLLNNQSQQEEG